MYNVYEFSVQTTDYQLLSVHIVIPGDRNGCKSVHTESLLLSKYTSRFKQLTAFEQPTLMCTNLAWLSYLAQQ